MQMLENFATGSYLEMDYVNERRNMDRFTSVVLPKCSKSHIRIPKVIFATRKVIATEWIEGKKLVDSDAKTINKLTPIGVQCFLVQLLDAGFFHADPHSANLLVDTRGRLCLIDFGLCAEVSQPDTKGMCEALVHLMSSDMKGLLEDAVQLGFLPPDVDRGRLLPVLSRVYDEAKVAADAVKSSRSGQGQMEPAYLPKQRRKQFAMISRDLNEIFFRFPFVVPAYFALITRALIVLEGIAVTGDPSFDIFKAAYPYARSRAIELFGWKGVGSLLSAANTYEAHSGR